MQNQKNGGSSPKDKFRINSMQRRIRVAFFSIILLLTLAGMMSLFELERVGHDTERILVKSRDNVELAEDMISALNKQNNALIYMALAEQDFEEHRENCTTATKELREATAVARRRLGSNEDSSTADSLEIYTNRLNRLTQDYLTGVVQAKIDSLNTSDMVQAYDSPLWQEEVFYNTHIWYVEEYKDEYINLSRQISKFMTESQSSLSSDVNQLNHSARRAVTPVCLSLLAMLVIMIMLYYFIHTYFIRPIKLINRSVQNYLTYKLSFDKNIKCRDEILTLKENIATLIDKLR